MHACCSYIINCSFDHQSLGSYTQYIDIGSHSVVEWASQLAIVVVATYVTGPAKTGHICTKYTCSENSTYIIMLVFMVNNFIYFLIDHSIKFSLTQLQQLKVQTYAIFYVQICPIGLIFFGVPCSALQPADQLVYQIETNSVTTPEIQS